MKVIYIAGKYRGPNSWAVEQNIRAAEEVAARVVQLGMMPMCTHPMTRHMGGLASDEHMLAGTLEIMSRCDAVLLVPNWRDSEGTRAEVAEAKRLGLPVFGEGYATASDCQHTDLSIDDLEQWAEHGESTSVEARLRDALEQCLVASDNVDGRESIHAACRKVGLRIDYAGDMAPTWSGRMRL